MDIFENGVSKDDNLDSWDIINGDLSEDPLDFEIIKNLFEITKPETDETDTDCESTDTQPIQNCKEDVLPKTRKTGEDSDSEVTTEEDVEETKKFNQGIKKGYVKTKFADRLESKLSAKKEPKFRTNYYVSEKLLLKNKIENKKKTRKSEKKTSFPLFNSANLGALLTAFGLSLIVLNGIDNKTGKTCSTNHTIKNFTASLTKSMNETTNPWHDDITSIFDDEKILEKYLPANFDLDNNERKNIKSKLMKGIDRRMKQHIRGFDIKPLKKEKKQDTGFIGPLNKDEFTEKYFKANKSGSRSYRDILLNSTCSNQKTEAICKNQNKTEINHIAQAPDVDMMKNSEDTDSKDLKITGTCGSIYRAFIRTEVAFKKIFNNNYQVPKSKTSSDLALSIENKINSLTEDNNQLNKIIEQQERLVHYIKDRIQLKKELLQKRSQEKHNLEKRLKFALWMKKHSNHEDIPPKSSDKILNHILITRIQNNKPVHSAVWIPEEKSTQKFEKIKVKPVSRSSTDIALRNEPNVSNSLNNETEIVINNNNNNNSYIKRKAEDILKYVDAKSMKLKDEEHARLNKLPDKSDPQRTWYKKKYEFK